MANKEYKIAIKIYGEMSRSLPRAARLTRGELRALARDVSQSEATHLSFGQRISRGLDNGLKSTEKIFGKMEKVGVSAFKKIAKAGATAGAAIAAGSVKAGSEFDTQMSTVKAITTATEKQYASMRKEAKNIGANSVFTANEAAQAMEYEGMAGWKTKDIIKGTKGITDLAAASSEDLATVSDIVTDALTAFGMSAKESSHFADVMAAAATNSNTNVSKMGESFKYAAPVAGTMGYSAEDTAIVLGLMANQGIKESRAGTATRSWITRMTKPTKESQMAMDALGISLTDTNGKEKDLLTLLEETREAFSKLDSKVEKSKYAKMLAGASGQTGLLALTNSSTKDFEKLKNAIYDCDGAAEEMAKVKLDNLEGDVKLFTSALEGAGIDIYDEIKEPLRDVVQSGTKWIGNFAKWFTNGGFASVKREITGAAESFKAFASPVIELGKWLIKNPDIIAGTIAGIGEAIIAYKVVSGVTSLVSGLAGLGGAGAAVMGVAGVITVVGGIGAALKATEKQAETANLANHFGKIALSMEDIDNAARKIVGNGYISRVEEFLSSNEKADGFVDSMNEAVEVINKMAWKVEAGIKIDKESLEEYKGGIEDYIKNAQEYISQQGYSVSVAVDLLLGKDGKNISSENNKWYSGLEEESAKLSKQIKKYMKKALKDVLDIDEQETIDKMLSQLENITKAVSDAQTKAKMDVLTGKYAGVDMTAESFENLQADLEKYVTEANEGAEQAYYEALATLEGRRASGDLKGAGKTEKYEKEKAQLTQGYYDTRVDALLKSYDFMMGKVSEKYGGDVSKVLSRLREEIKSAAAEEDAGTKSILNVATSYLNSQGLSTGEKDAISTLLEKITPTFDKIAEIQTQANNQGITLANADKVSKASEEMNDYQTVIYKGNDFEKFFTGSYDPTDITEYVGRTTSGTDAQKKLQDVNIWGQECADNFAKGVKAGMSEIPGEVDSIMKDVKSITSEEIEVPVMVKTTATLSSAGLAVADVAKKTLEKTKAKSKTQKHASGGIFTKEHLGIVAEAGYPESIIPIRKSEHSLNLWERTGMMLGQKMSGNNLFQSYAQRMQKASAGKMGKTGESLQNVQIQYSPQIVIQGNADKTKVSEALRSGYAEFEKYMKRYQKTKGRVSLVSN